MLGAVLPSPTPGYIVDDLLRDLTECAAFAAKLLDSVQSVLGAVLPLP